METQIFLSEEARAADPTVVGSQEWSDGFKATTGQEERNKNKKTAVSGARSPVGAAAGVHSCIDFNENESAPRLCRSRTAPGVFSG